MTDWDLPQDVQTLFNYFHTKAAALFLVGGAVRDLLRGVQPVDYDFTINQPIDELLNLLHESPFTIYRQGELFGTIGVILNRKSYEITSFRKEGLYLDHRHPESILFTPHIEEDLARRDFTINAMAWSPQTGLVDPFGGKNDLLNLKIRAVGDPRKRMAEDALRILRALRFAAAFEAEIMSETAHAMEAFEEKIVALSAERIGDELLKLFSTERALATFAHYPWAWHRSLEAVGREVSTPDYSYVGSLDPWSSVVLLVLSTPEMLMNIEDWKLAREDVFRVLALIYRRSDHEDLRALRKLLNNHIDLDSLDAVFRAWAWPEDFRRNVLLTLADYLVSKALQEMDAVFAAVLFTPERFERLCTLRKARGEDLPGFCGEDVRTLRRKIPLDQEALGWAAEELMARGYRGEAIRRKRAEGLLEKWS